MKHPKELEVVLLATYAVERTLKENPSRQISRLKKWCKARGWTVARAYYFNGVLNLRTGRDGIGMAITAAKEADGVIALLDPEGKPTALKVMDVGGD